MALDTAFRAELKKNVQGDILGDGFLKQVELFHFFQINQNQAAAFRKRLFMLMPLIADVEAQELERQRIRVAVANVPARSDATSQDSRDKFIKSAQANIAFTAPGLIKMQKAGANIDPDISKQGVFSQGMEASAVTALADPPKTSGGQQPAWDHTFLGRQIDGVLLITANSNSTARAKLAELLAVLGSTVGTLKIVMGNARTGLLRRHEHFGFLDGTSEPGVLGFDKLELDVNKDNQEDVDDKLLIDPGIVLCNRDGDRNASSRPAWAKDGSFLAFRWLEQKVPEFWSDVELEFCKSLGLNPTQENQDAVAARMVGRWKSGAPVTTNPDSDPLPVSLQANMTREQIDAALNVDARIDFGPLTDATKCPLGAHIRKMNPRVDLGLQNRFRIVRRGIQFGPEVSAAEMAARKTNVNTKRGLLFACYQSNLEDGFEFLQQTWANNEAFPGTGAGIDPMIGQQNKAGTSQLLGMNKTDPTKPINLSFVSEYVVPLGGEYFFSPSMSALTTVLGDGSGGFGKVMGWVRRMKGKCWPGVAADEEGNSGDSGAAAVSKPSLLSMFMGHVGL